VGVVEKDQYDGDLFKDWLNFRNDRLEKVSQNHCKKKKKEEKKKKE